MCGGSYWDSNGDYSYFAPLTFPPCKTPKQTLIHTLTQTPPLNLKTTGRVRRLLLGQQRRLLVLCVAHLPLRGRLLRPGLVPHRVPQLHQQCAGEEESSWVVLCFLATISRKRSTQAPCKLGATPGLVPHRVPQLHQQRSGEESSSDGPGGDVESALLARRPRKFIGVPVHQQRAGKEDSSGPLKSSRDDLRGGVESGTQALC